MLADKDVWRTGPDGILAASVGDYRLVVRAAEETGGWARFLVLHRRGEDAAEVLIGSGCEADCRAAMRSALFAAAAAR